MLSGVARREMGIDLFGGQASSGYGAHLSPHTLNGGLYLCRVGTASCVCCDSTGPSRRTPFASGVPFDSDQPWADSNQPDCIPGPGLIGASRTANGTAVLGGWLADRGTLVVPGGANRFFGRVDLPRLGLRTRHEKVSYGPSVQP